MKFRKLGILLLVASIGISSTNFAFTGAVIGAGIYSWLNVLAVVLFIVGVVMTFVSGTLEQRVAVEEGVVEPSEFYNNLSNYVAGSDSVFVVDTSFVGSYTGRGAMEAINYLKSKGRIVVTDSVLKETNDWRSDVRDFLLKSSEPPRKGFEQFRSKAREYLGESKKAKYSQQVINIIMGKEGAPSRREAQVYMPAVRKIVYSMGKSGKALNGENLQKEIERHWKVSDTDVDVLAAAMAEISEGKEAYVTERDSDFEDAIREAKLDRLHYANSYGRIV